MCYDCDEYDDYDGYDDYEDYEEWLDEIEDDPVGEKITDLVYKAPNGHIVLIQCVIARPDGDYLGNETKVNNLFFGLNELTDRVKERCIELGRTLKPGEQCELFFDDDEPPVVEASPDYIPF